MSESTKRFERCRACGWTGQALNKPRQACLVCYRGDLAIDPPNIPPPSLKSRIKSAVDEIANRKEVATRRSEKEAARAQSDPANYQAIMSKSDYFSGRALAYSECLEILEGLES